MLTAIAVALWCLVGVEMARGVARWRLHRYRRALRGAGSWVDHSPDYSYMSQHLRELRIADAARLQKMRGEPVGCMKCGAMLGCHDEHVCPLDHPE